jgi:hypothetical protein
MTHQMRAAWSRRTDEELLHAFFLEELSTTGRDVVEQLVVEKVGPVDAYLAAFAREQGEIVAAFPVRGCEVGDAPAMWGHIMLTTNGIGFVAEGAERSLASELAGDVAAFGFTFLSGTLLPAIAERILDDGGTVTARSSSVPNTAPLPLLATIEPSFAWVPRAQIEELLWSPDVCEVIRGGERVLWASPAADADDVVSAWAEKYGIPLIAIEPTPFSR